jgi:hypothetical protein
MIYYVGLNLFYMKIMDCVQFELYTNNYGDTKLKRNNI